MKKRNYMELKMKFKIINGLEDDNLNSVLTDPEPKFQTEKAYLRKEKILHWICLVQYDRLDQLIAEIVDALHSNKGLLSWYYLYLLLIDAKKGNPDKLTKKLKRN